MPYLRKTGLLAITCLSLTIFGAMTVRADTVVFTNRAAFTAASTGLTTINFEGIAAANSVANFASPLTLQGTTFAGSPTGAISVVDSGFFSPLFQFNSGAVLSGFGFIDVTLPAGATAIGADIMSTNPDGQSFRFCFPRAQSLQSALRLVQTVVSLASLSTRQSPQSTSLLQGFPLWTTSLSGKLKARQFPSRFQWFYSLQG